MAFLLARKLHMTQQFRNDEVVPVTVLDASPCVVTDVRTVERDGYAAVQIGSGKARRVTKPLAGHLRGRGAFQALREFRMDGALPEVGAALDVSSFTPGMAIQVSAVSKGKGFQGVMKRHHFHGQDATHGTKHAHREAGSIAGGGRNCKGRVIKGMRMAGRMGGDRVTVQGLEVVAVDPEHGQLFVKGAVPGARGALVEVRTYDGHWTRRHPAAKSEI
ncbi:50S ribosomal protein L3 [Candidatus Uhrbacteria bacterium]|nr:50S ribosomal protein L3 [Candidatus Uhrbacteria bacterium]